MLGHSSIETTAGYRHVAVDGASNPLDDLLTHPPGTASPGDFLAVPVSSECQGKAAGNAISQRDGATSGIALPPVWWKHRPLAAVT